MRSRRLRRILPVIAIIISLALAVVLYKLMAGYDREVRDRSEELFLLDLEKYEEMKQMGELDEDLDPADKELAYKLENYNFYEKLKEKLRVNVLFLGNGVAEGAGLEDTSYSWVDLIAEEIRSGYGSELQGANYGKSGTDIFYGYHVTNAMSLGITYDLVVICYGAEDDPEIFEKYYDGLLRSVKNQNPKCEIYCIIEANSNGYNTNSEVIRELCAFYDAVCIDMNGYFDTHNLDKTKNLSGILPDIVGNRAYYECVSDVISEGVQSGREISEEIKPYLESSHLFDSYRYIERDDMKKISDGVYEFSAYGNMATLLTRPTASAGEIKIYVNGKKVLTDDGKPMPDDVIIKLIPFADNLEGVNKIRIETGADSVSSILGVGLHGDN